MTCIQGFVAAVPTENRAAFIDHAARAMRDFRDHGLVAGVECWGDDLPDGEVTSFPLAVKAKADETVIFSWYVWPSRAAHDAGMKAAMADPRLGPEQNPMPFDGKRVIFGAFEPLVEHGAPQKGGYVDGFVIPVPRANREAFRKQAADFAPIFAEHGVNWLMECWEQDVPDGSLTDFRRAVQAKPDEAIVFSWVQWPDKATRDAGNAKMMQDKRFEGMVMPFDGKRMILGGFVPVVEV
ncbi:DUF1428 domain-containing protein [Roseinatronobacter alkalisoli]|uniref:DUF1428 domain-containing protein n=1 Tax=Roseinatronobacter alkalisoli TaxID=3028235 RepID=A0ABT5T695_9RHOB|nr:DUF1428 domain-containing protein [Roseinatronobacter sp. HJB301]MDD7970631.1 DUF1428 domain-containing protein [Roseinatronobacter sp. HJB301]